MLKSLHIENFKAFGRRVEIPFAPVTLIFGENSAGKSSILHALSLLKQTLADRKTEAILLPRSELDLVDLGSFQEMLFNHDLERELSFRLEVDMGYTRGFLLPNSNPGSGAIEVHFSRRSSADEIQVRELVFHHSRLNSEPVARFKPPVRDAKSHFKVEHLENGVPNQRKQETRVECTHVTQNVEWWKPIYEKFKENIAGFRKDLERQRARLEGRQSLIERYLAESKTDIRQTHSAVDKQHLDRVKRRHDWNIAELSDIQQSLERIRDELRFLETDFDLSSFAGRMRSAQLGTTLVLDGFLPKDIEHSGYYERRASLFSVGMLACEIAQYSAEALEQLLPLGPFRKPPDRWYTFTGTSPQDVGHQGQSFAAFLLRNEDAVEQANIWLERLDIGYKLRIVPLNETQDLFEIRLQDLRNSENIDVSLKDVGFGISQILPLVVQCLAAQKQIISIEQPEIHIHPRLQADLGDLLAEAIKAPRENQMIVETHSEHLVLRLQRLVRSGELSPDDVSIIYVNRGKGGASVRRLRLDEEGDFIDRWPGGFFPERLRELM